VEERKDSHLYSFFFLDNHREESSIFLKGKKMSAHITFLSENI
jgi:hypothetical protein